MKMFFAAIALGSIAIPASAEEVRIEVHYDDLNLESVAGQEMLDRRINWAARKACGADIPATGSHLSSVQARACVDELTAKAQRQFASIGEGMQIGG